MATGTVDEGNPPVTIEEQYATITSSSNLRVELDRRSPADMVIAAGMNPHSMGMALTRLLSEWDCSAKPIPMTPKQIEQLAASFAREPDGEYAGMVQIVTSKGDVEYRLPLALAGEQAAQWHAHELGILFQRMKSLPWVRDGLLFEARAQGWDGDIHLVASVLQWWLFRACPACHGVKLRVIAGTGRTGSRACGRCHGSGEATLPHGWQGRRMVSYINDCRIAAIKGLQGKFSHHAK